MSDTVHPFRIDVPEADLDELRRRLRAAPWPEREPVDGWEQGIPLAYLREVCAYWAESYDWRRCEALLNGWPQFRTVVDGLGIHFLHVQSPEADALPIVITHGWPGSVLEFHKIIGPLTNPTAFGGDRRDAFHVVCPSLPGYGFSDKPSETGWGVERIARAWGELMRRLGYARYVAQGGDWGALVTTLVGTADPGHCAGIHVNMPVVPPDPAVIAQPTEREQAALAALQHYDQWDSGYSKQQSTRPQTVGYSLVDSPVGLAAWILEKFWSWTDCNGHPENALTRDELLDNVMLYWLPATGASAARLYWQSFRNFDPTPVDVPAGCSIFPKEIFRPSRRWAAARYRNIVYWNELERGGHFAAFEQPELFVQEVRACFRPMRA